MAFSLGPTGILGHGIMYRGSYASGGNSSHYSRTEEPDDRSICPLEHEPK